eukprot:g1507.t1
MSGGAQQRTSASAGAAGGGTQAKTRSDGQGVYGREEVSALKGIFNLYDAENTGTIGVKELEGILQKVGHNPDDVARVMAAAADTEAGMDGRVSFDEFIRLLEQAGPAGPLEGPDPKVMEFLRILEEYRVKCEEGGDYLEAGRAQRQLDVLRRQETKRQQKAVRARQLCERQDVQVAHNMQFQDFNAAWNKYLEEYDRMAQMYVQQMTERHAVGLMEHQRKLQQELRDKPPKWSKELLEWRRRQHILARQKNYAEAQKVKKIADQLEESERSATTENWGLFLARKEAAFRGQQQSELQALLKRIDARRKEHIKQRNLDSKRLLQRNRNVQTVLESKQNVEGLKLTEEIKKSVMGTVPGVPSMPPDPTQKIPPEARGRVRRKKKAGARGSTAAGDGGDADRTFVTSGAFPEVDHPSVIDGHDS